MWISKSKWEQLNSKLEAQKADIKSYSKFSDKVAVMFVESKELKEANEALKAELEKYKKLYADELQKRLELADKVRGLESK